MKITLETIYKELIDFRARTEERLINNEDQHKTIGQSIQSISDTLSGKSNGNGMPYSTVAKFVRDMDTDCNWRALKFANAIRKYVTSVFTYISGAGILAIISLLLYLWAHKP